MPVSDEKQDINATRNIPIEAYDRRRRRSRSAWKKWFKKFTRRFSFRITLISIFIFIIVTSVVFGALISDAVADLRNSWQTLERVLTTVNTSDGTDLTLEDLTRLQSSADEMSSRLSAVRGRLSLLGPLINLNKEWAVTQDSLDVAQELTDATKSMLDGVQPSLTFMVAGETEEAVATRISSGERVVELLELGQGNFAQASDRLSIADNMLNEIDLTDVSPELLLQIEELKDFHDQLSSINQLLISSPDLLTTMLGFDEERSYLVLAQNNDEIRPSGGYVSTYGWFTVRSARIINYDYQPTSATSPNPPNDDFLDNESIVIPDWWISYNQPVYVAWDGSWHADFPSTADMALSYYNEGDNPESPLDGVLAIDITGFELMLSAMGEVFVDDYGVTVTSANFRNLVYDIRAFGEGEVPHKRFITSIYSSIFEEWSELDQETSPAFLGAILEGFQQKHIMLYFADETLNHAVDTLRWSGRQISDRQSDYLLIADANLGNKSNNSIRQPITYDVELLSDGSANSRLTIGFEYFDEVASLDPAVDDDYHGPLDYRSLLQVFLPSGSVITDIANVGDYDFVTEDNYNIFITRSIVEYDSGERYQILYLTPSMIEEVGEFHRYRLLIQNQPGSRTQSLNVQVTLPEDAEVISTSPEADASYTLEQPIVDFRLELSGDRLIEVIYQTD